jgi:hypothetical protein
MLVWLLILASILIVHIGMHAENAFWEYSPGGLVASVSILATLCFMTVFAQIAIPGQSATMHQLRQMFAVPMFLCAVTDLVSRRRRFILPYLKARLQRTP